MGAVRIIRVPPAGGTAAPLSVPTYASATYGCALAHSPQTTLEVRATFYSRLSQPVTAIARPVSIGPHFWGSITCDRSIIAYIQRDRGVHPRIEYSPVNKKNTIRTLNSRE